MNVIEHMEKVLMVAVLCLFAFTAIAHADISPSGKTAVSEQAGAALDPNIPVVYVVGKRLPK